MPIMRPLWVEFPADGETYGMEDQFMLGNALLIKPVTAKGQSSVNVYLPGDQPWYDIKNYQQYAGAQTLSVATPFNKIPVFQRGSTIVAKRERARRNSALMERDPFTLFVALDKDGSASGNLYMDDGASFAYQQGAYHYRQFSYDGHKLTVGTGSISTLLSGSHIASQSNAISTVVRPNGAYTNPSLVERVIIWGVTTPYTKAVLRDGAGKVTPLVFSQSGTSVVIRKPDVAITSDFTIELIA
jgi:alpha 1,3-glucosidase